MATATAKPKPKADAKAKAKAKPQPKSGYTLDDFEQAAGSDHLLDLQEIEAFLGCDAALTTEELDEVWDDVLATRGYPVDRVIGAIKESGTRAELTELGRALIELRLGDWVRIEPDRQLHGAQIQELFSIPKATVETALGGHGFSAAEFAEWVDREQVEHHCSVDVLASILRHRRITAAAEAAAKAEAERPREFHELVETAIQADEAAERAEAEKQRQDRLRLYRQILGRRHTPQGRSDAGRLAFICRELGIDREQLRADCKALDRHDMLTKMSSDVDQAEAAMKKLRGEIDELEKVVKTLDEKRREHGVAMEHWRRCSRAGTEAKRLRDANPDLFESE